ncbi:hypothetical protein [Stieleria neptunia]|uniref:hypothetical protein n=1 Tax=Stieleria neptunia TaxID=2527979 RepID=UPI0011A6721E|nr:hypothetical protein [Stieleria neptunia]
MIPDPTAEIKRIRHQLAADDGFDLDRIFARIRRVQAESGRTCIRRPSRKPANHAKQRSGGGDVSASGESTPAAR